MMKNIVIISLLSSTVLLSACNDDDKKQPIIIPDNPVKAFKDYQGSWENRGTGQLWSFSEEKLIRYNYNSYGCVKVKSHELFELKNISNLFTLNNDKTQFIFDDKGTLVDNFESINQLPDTCQPNNLLSTKNTETNFEFIWHSINDYYAFFDKRKIDWQQIYDQYRPLVTSSTSDNELFDIMTDAMEVFDDGHLGLDDNAERSFYSDDIGGFSLEVFRSALVDVGDNYNEAYNELMTHNENVLKSLLQHNKLNQYQDGNAIRWGKMSDNVGYLRIDRVQSINFSNIQDQSENVVDALAAIKQDLVDTDTIMKTALTELDNTEAMIIDLRFNQGGLDNVSLAIASHFSDKSLVIGTKQINNKNYQNLVQQLNIISSPISAYTKPVYVITGNSTASGGEVLSMALKALPQVTVIGEATSGSVSDALEHTLPNSWSLSLSHQIYRDVDGQGVEVTGVTPDVEMSVYATQDIFYGSNTPIDYAMQEISEISKSTPKVADVEHAFETFFKKTNIPGIAVAVIKGDEIVYQKAYGMANIEQEIPVTMDTPFNVGSISKAVLATAMMQQVEQGKISLEDELTQMNLSFNPNNPENSGDGITLRHLVTHTSGIRDSAGYLCSYYLHENNASLLYLIGGEHCPETATSNPTTFFADDYFNVNGRYVMDGIFNADEDGLPDEDHDYSNVGSGLAAYAIEQKLGFDFADVMKQSIFTPLNMHNTAWHHFQLSNSNPKAVQYSINEDLELLVVPEFSYPTLYDGDLNISANDLSKLLITIMNGGEYQGTRILKEESVVTMLSSQTDVLNQRDTQGVFWYWLGSFVGHSGGDPGTNALMQYNTATKTGIVILMNGEDDHIGKGEVNSMITPLFSTLYRYGLAQ